MTRGWSGLDLGIDQLVVRPHFTLIPCPQPLGNQLGADHGHLARGLDPQPDLSLFETDDCYANVVSNEEFFHQCSSQYQHGTLPLRLFASRIGINDEPRRRSRGSSQVAGCSSMSHPSHRPKCCVLRRLGACIDRIADQSSHDPLNRNVLRPGQLAQMPLEIGGQRDEDLGCRIHGNPRFVVSETMSAHKRAQAKRLIRARRK